MIKIKFFYRENRFNGFVSQGHSGFAEEGSDVLCAGVSALLQGAVLGLNHYAPQDQEYEIKSGYLSCRVNSLSEFAQEHNAILNTAALSVINLAIQQPKYISFHIEGMPNWQNKSPYTEEDYQKLSNILK